EQGAAIGGRRNVGQGRRAGVEVVDGGAVDVHVLRVQGDPGYDGVARGVKFRSVTRPSSRRRSGGRARGPSGRAREGAGCSGSTSARAHRRSPAAVSTTTPGGSARPHHADP